MSNREKYELILNLLSAEDVLELGRDEFKVVDLMQNLKAELEKSNLAVNSIQGILNKILYASSGNLPLKIRELIDCMNPESGKPTKADIWGGISRWPYSK